MLVASVGPQKGHGWFVSTDDQCCEGRQYEQVTTFHDCWLQIYRPRVGRDWLIDIIMVETATVQFALDSRPS